MKLFLYIKLALVRLWRNIYGPVVEIDIDNIYDRMANPISGHDLLKLFEMEDEDAAKYYQKHNQEIFSNQNGEWLRNFLGKPKKIPYWLTPWGGCVKDYSKRKRLSLEHSKKYIDELKSIRASLKREGYNYKKYGYITGQLLEGFDGSKKLIIWNGHRRILSLASLEYKKIKVEISGGDRWQGKIQNHIIKISKLRKWCNMKKNLYTQRECRIFFNKFFLN